MGVMTTNQCNYGDLIHKQHAQKWTRLTSSAPVGTDRFLLQEQNKVILNQLLHSLHSITIQIIGSSVPSHVLT